MRNNGRPRSRIGLMVDEHTSKMVFSYGVCRHNSSAYMAALGLNIHDMEGLERIQDCNEGMIHINVDGEKFSIGVHMTCGIPHSYDWEYMLIATAENPELNESFGGGTTHINIVPPDWHEKIINALENDSIDLHTKVTGG